MTLKLSVLTRNAKLDAIEAFIGNAPVLKLRSGTPPANIADADAGTVIATMALPTDWMAPAAAGIKAKAGTWADPAADLAGTITYFRIYASDGTTQHIQGTVSLPSGGGDMELQAVVVNLNQTITILTFQLTEGNA